MGEVVGGGYGYPGGVFHSTAAILVLFILLVIITRAIVY
ncbi:YjcZ family sporulation protein [Paenibacillus sp. FSL W8-0194]